MIMIKNVEKHYGRNNVLKKINLEIHPGDCIGIVGANGSGKTTLLSIISGMLNADAGELLIDDKNILNSKKLLSEYISYVPQENPLIGELSAMDNLRLWYKGSKKELNEELSSGILHTLGIDSFVSKTVNKMSGGMKKRLSIGIALLSNPKLLVMDEPSAALDIAGKYEIKKYMNYYSSEKHGSILIVSHDFSELSVCNRLYLLKDGILKEIPNDTDESKLVSML